MDLGKIKYFIETTFLRLRKNRTFVFVDGKNTLEILNFEYNLDFDDTYCEKNILENSEHDKIERNKIIKKITDNINIFRNDLNSRRFVIRENYNDDENLASCISTLHFLIRKNFIYLFVYVRSQNYFNNFDYDNQSFMMFASHMKSLLGYQYEIAPIDIRIGSLHSIVNE